MAQAAAPGTAGSPFSASRTTDNLPPGCAHASGITFDDGCYHMRGELNALDSPKIDVLLLVPASPYAERDLRAMHQVVDMYAAGIPYIAHKEGMDWLANGVEFHVTPMVCDPVNGDCGDLSTYPAYDPEIVIFRGNPFFIPLGLSAILGIGIDPLAPSDGPVCTGVANPLDIEQIKDLPGFHSHDNRTGVYKENCNGSGGHTCFAINGGTEPLPGSDIWGLNVFDLVAHEFGHCLRLGHVGDSGTEFSSTPAPVTDIMSYKYQDTRKCVSSLDVEMFAVAMSPFLDVNGDGAVTAADRLYNNDHLGVNDGSMFQAQRVQDHYYASSTGNPEDCPQPDLGLVPLGKPVDFTPAGSDSNPVVGITSPSEGASGLSSPVTVSGTVDRAVATGPADLGDSLGTDEAGDTSGNDACPTPTPPCDTANVDAARGGLDLRAAYVRDDGDHVTFTFQVQDGDAFFVDPTGDPDPVGATAPNGGHIVEYRLNVGFTGPSGDQTPYGIAHDVAVVRARGESALTATYDRKAMTPVGSLSGGLLSTATTIGTASRSGDLFTVSFPTSNPDHLTPLTNLEVTSMYVVQGTGSNSIVSMDSLSHVDTTSWAPAASTADPGSLKVPSMVPAMGQSAAAQPMPVPHEGFWHHLLAGLGFFSGQSSPSQVAALASNDCSGSLPEPTVLVAPPTCSLAVPGAANHVRLTYHGTYTGLFSANVILYDGSGTERTDTFTTCGSPATTAAVNGDYACVVDVTTGVTAGTWYAEIWWQVGEAVETYEVTLEAFTDAVTSTTTTTTSSSSTSTAPPTNERVELYEGASLLGSQDVSTSVSDPTDTWSIAATLASGSHTVTAKWFDAGDDSTSTPLDTADVTFTVSGGSDPCASDSTAPVISAVSATVTGTTSATIAWTTGEAGTSVVNYGTTASYGSTASAAGSGTSHSVGLTGLSPGTTYQFEVVSADACGNSASQAGTAFTTTSPPPTLAFGQDTAVAVVEGTDVDLTLAVPSGHDLLSVVMSGPACDDSSPASVALGPNCSFDADLFVRNGAAAEVYDGDPTVTDANDCSSYNTGNDEACDMPAEAGVWHVLVHSFAGSGTVTVRPDLDLPDQDHDGVPDARDSDRDGDGVDNDVEGILGTDPNAPMAPPPLPNEVTVCAPGSGSSTATADFDHDGKTATYTKGDNTQVTVGTDGSHTSKHPKYCWVNGDPNDDGQEHPSAAGDGFVAEILLPTDPSATAPVLLGGQDLAIRVKVLDGAGYAPTSGGAYRLVLQVDCGAFQGPVNALQAGACAGGIDTTSMTKVYGFVSTTAGTLVTVPSADQQALLNGMPATALHIWVDNAAGQSSNYAQPTTSLLVQSGKSGAPAVDSVDATLWTPVLLVGGASPPDRFVAEILLPTDPSATAPVLLGGSDLGIKVKVLTGASYAAANSGTYRLVLQVDCGAAQPVATTVQPGACAGGSDTTSLTRSYSFVASRNGATVTVPAADQEALLNGLPATALHIWVEDASGLHWSNYAQPTTALMVQDGKDVATVADNADGTLWTPVVLVGAPGGSSDSVGGLDGLWPTVSHLFGLGWLDQFA